MGTYRHSPPTVAHFSGFPSPVLTRAVECAPVFLPLAPPTVAENANYPMQLVPAALPLQTMHTKFMAMHADAMTTLGEAHLYGLGLVDVPDRVRALKLFLCAAKFGDVKAAGLVGFMFEFGLGVPQSFVQCELYYQAAALHGHAFSMARLTYLKRYEVPLGIRRSYDEADFWDARVHELMQPGAPQWVWNAPSAWGTDWRRDDYEQGDPCGEIMLGNCYTKALGVDRDAPLAFRYYLQAAMQGDVVAMGIAGRCYREGIGMNAPDYTRAQE
ncbi:hypothetical protein GGF31_008278 [Allomyces arbusculus]|nr:hypothetical protein GGF31_008278 [Allomyces arbusculus]